jgi:thiamine pyrophosphokinase
LTAVTGAANSGGFGAVLVANGVLHPDAVALLRDAIEQARLVIGVDGGTRHLLAHGLLPHVVTGDFDSLTENERADLESRGVRLIETPDQDYTDLDKALGVAVERFHAETVRVFAATAGRLDHVYSNLSALLRRRERVAEIRLVDETGETWPVMGDVRLTGADLPGRTLSLMALGPVHGVTTTGVRWPLSDATLVPGVRDGTLNEIIAETVTIRHASGYLLVMLHHAPSAILKAARTADR